MPAPKTLPFASNTNRAIPPDGVWTIATPFIPNDESTAPDESKRTNGAVALPDGPSNPTAVMRPDVPMTSEGEFTRDGKHRDAVRCEGRVGRPRASAVPARKDL